MDRIVNIEKHLDSRNKNKQKKAHETQILDFNKELDKIVNNIAEKLFLEYGMSMLTPTDSIEFLEREGNRIEYLAWLLTNHVVSSRPVEVEHYILYLDRAYKMYLYDREELKKEFNI